MEIQIPPLVGIFTNVVDWRKARGKRYELKALLVLVVLAILCGKKEIRGMSRWGAGLAATTRQRLGLPMAKSPSAATLCRVLWQVAVEEIEAGIEAWAAEVHRQLVAAGISQGVAIDGKTVRRAASLGAKEAHLVAAVCHQIRLVLGQKAVADKSNELGVIHPLLLKLCLQGIVITVDALFTQRGIAEQIRQQRGHYIMFVKGNQPKLQWAIRQLFAPPAKPGLPPPATARTVDKGHGRLEVRQIATSTALTDYLDWPAAAQVFQLVRQVTYFKNGHTTTETVYGITSLAPTQASPTQLLAHIRHHWAAIENGLHWVRDVVMGEDASAVHKQTAPHTLAALRNLAISFAHLAGFASMTAAIDAFSANPTLPLSRMGL